MQELLNNPTPLNKPDERFKGRDWRSIEIGELVTTEDVRFVETNTSVEEATNVSPPLRVMKGIEELMIEDFDYLGLTACGAYP